MDVPEKFSRFAATLVSAGMMATALPNACKAEGAACSPHSPELPHTHHGEPGRAPPPAVSLGLSTNTGTGTATPPMPFNNNSAQISQQDVARSQPQSFVMLTPNTPAGSRHDQQLEQPRHRR